MQRFSPVENCDLLIIAGETSGDEHAGILVAHLKELCPTLRIAALGGRHLADAGAIMLEDLTAHARVGVWEVIKHLGAFFKLINETIGWIDKNKPRMVLFVDFVGFNLEVARRLHQKKLSHKAGGGILTYFYISPQIWAWKSHRRFKIARWIDSVGCIFPFEPQYYQDTSLEVKFVGHPFVCKEFQNPLGYTPRGPVILLPGSRTALVKKHLPILWESFKLYRQKAPQAKAAAYYASEPLRQLMVKLTQGQLTLYPAGTPIKASAAICTAGTISLTCALAAIPSLMIYKTDPLTFAYGKSVYKRPYLGMPNILLNRLVIPEFWQGKVNPRELSLALETLLTDANSVAHAKNIREEIEKLLHNPVDLDAAAWILNGLTPKG